MIQNAHVAGYDFVFEYSAGRNIDTIAVIGNNDHSALWKMSIDISRMRSIYFSISTYAQRNTTTEGHISTDCQVIELNDVGYVGKAPEELLYLGEMILAQLDQWCGGEHTLWRHYQAAVLQCVQIGHDQQQIR